MRIGQTHAACDLFGSRIVKIEKLAAVRRNERAVDINRVDELHGRIIKVDVPASR
jgi:hypothetical protein